MDEDHNWIATLRAGTFAGIYRIRELHIRTDRRGGYYLDLALFDASGVLPAKFWRAHPNMLDAIKVGDYLQVQGRVEMASDALQIVLDSFELAPEHLIFPERYERVSERDPMDTLTEVHAIMLGLEDPQLRDLADAYLYDDDFVALLLETPGSYRRHHAWAAGLLDHTLSMLKLAIVLANHYPSLNRDLLLVGAFVHDLGKVREFDWDGEAQTSLEGRLLGHIPLGIELLTAKAAECEAFPDEKLLVLKHMIYAHHESARYGSPKAPLIPEALALQSIEALDSRLATMFETLASPIEVEYEGGSLHRGHTGARWAFKPKPERADEKERDA